MDEIMHMLTTKFSIHHSTLQIEQGTTNHSCPLSPSNSEKHQH
jgi:cobalt-zinc-cadmium efflux system protein